MPGTELPYISKPTPHLDLDLDRPSSRRITILVVVAVVVMLVVLVDETECLRLVVLVVVVLVLVAGVDEAECLRPGVSGAVPRDPPAPGSLPCGVIYRCVLPRQTSYSGTAPEEVLGERGVSSVLLAVPEGVALSPAWGGGGGGGGGGGNDLRATGHPCCSVRSRSISDARPLRTLHGTETTSV